MLTLTTLLQKRYIVGQLIGAACGLGTALLWIMAMWYRSPVMTLSSMSFAIAFVMALLAIVAAIAAVRAHHKALLLIFVASFFPIGLYLLNVPHWLHWVGVLNLGYLVAWLLIWKTDAKALLHL